MHVQQGWLQRARQLGSSLSWVLLHTWCGADHLLNTAKQGCSGLGELLGYHCSRVPKQLHATFQPGDCRSQALEPASAAADCSNMPFGILQ